MIRSLTLDSSWVRQHHNIFLTGKCGVGKSFLACALVEKACRDGFTAYYRRVPQLFRDLSLARADGSLRSLLAHLAKIDVLLVDDWAMAPLVDAERRDFLEICEDRYQVRSTILTSQIPVAQWHEQIGDPTSADSILDRLVHNAYRIELESESMRKKRGGKERRFTPNVTGFAPESATDFSSESLTAFVGIRTYALTLSGGRRFNLAGRCGGSNLVARLLLSGLIVVEFLSTEAQECSAHLRAPVS